jgi:hypothetical protein
MIGVSFFGSSDICHQTAGFCCVTTCPGGTLASGVQRAIMAVASASTTNHGPGLTVTSAITTNHGMQENGNRHPLVLLGSTSHRHRLKIHGDSMCRSGSDSRKRYTERQHHLQIKFLLTPGQRHSERSSFPSSGTQGLRRLRGTNMSQGELTNKNQARQ